MIHLIQETNQDTEAEVDQMLEEYIKPVEKVVRFLITLISPDIRYSG
jgi:hypothetical protein